MILVTFFSTFISIKCYLPISNSLSILPCITDSSSTSSGKSSAFATMRIIFLLFRCTSHFYNLKFHSQMSLQKSFTHKKDLWVMVTFIVHILLVLVITWCRSRCSSFSIMTVKGVISEDLSSISSRSK